MTRINSFDDATMRRIVDMVRERMRTSQAIQSRPSRMQDVDGNYLAQTKSGGIPARSGAKCGKALCTMLFIDENDDLVPMRTSAGVNIERLVWNTSTEEIEESAYIQTKLIGAKLFVDRSNQGGMIGSKVKFRAISNVANRTINTVVLNSAFGALPRGTLLQVFDPNNLWGGITIGCIGFASYNAMLERYEIETCSLPASEVIVHIEDELTAAGDTPEGTLISTYALRSTYPNVMKPPICTTSCIYTWDRSLASWQLTSECEGDCVCTGPPENPPANPDLEGQTAPGICVPDDNSSVVINYTNPFKLDAVCNSDIVLQRVSNADFGDTLENAPSAGSASAFKWEVVKVFKKHARWITFTYEEGILPNPTSFCDGFDPTECGPITVNYPLGEPCDGSRVVAYYCPESNSYNAISTDSAMLGEPDIVDLPIGAESDPCGIAFKSLPFKVFTQTCDAVDAEPDLTVVKLGETVPVVVGMSTDTCGKITYAYQNIKAFPCDNEGSPTGPSFSDVSINLGGAKFLDGAASSFGGPDCSGSAEWTWNLIDPNDPNTQGAWQLTTPCPNGCTTSPPDASVPVGPGYTATTPCASSPGGSCGLNLVFKTLEDLCNEAGGTPSPGETVHVPLPLSPQTVVVDVYQDVDAIVVQKGLVYVCEYASGDVATIPLEECPTDPGSGGT